MTINSSPYFLDSCYFSHLGIWHDCCFKNPKTAPAAVMQMRLNRILDKVYEHDSFEDVTEEEIIFLWQSLKSGGLSGDEAWHAIVTGIALDMAFARSRSAKQIDH